MIIPEDSLWYDNAEEISLESALDEQVTNLLRYPLLGYPYLPHLLFEVARGVPDPCHDPCMTYQKLMRQKASHYNSRNFFFGPPFEYLRRLREQIVKFFKKNSQTGCKTINLGRI